MTRKSHPERVAHLSRRSVSKGFDAFRDVAWDAPEMAIDPEDPRWERSGDDALGGTDWYRSLPAPTRARLGLHLIARQLKVGVQFENILSRGLLALASTLPDGAPELRYAYHEVIEEAQHSLMFMELVRRAGLPVVGISGLRWRLAQRVPDLGRTFPELFLLHVLAGEAPIDLVQRRELETNPRMHPLLERVVRIHVTEEARHLSFATSSLREWVPRLGRLRAAHLRIAAPIVLGQTAGQMIHLPREIADRYGMPAEVVRGYRTHPATRALVHAGLAPVRDLCVELGLVTPATLPLWRAFGIWPEAPGPLLAP